MTRQELAAIIERYLGEDIRARELGDATDRLWDRTEDQTVHEIVHRLYFHYDDYVDHPVVAAKEEWDWFQRVLLLLRSDAELEWTKQRRWTIRQPVAACGVVAFVVAALAIGFRLPLLLVFVPLGCLSAVLYEWRDRSERRRWQQDTGLNFPFSSAGEMLAVRRRASGFAKARYPAHLRDRRIRHHRLAEFGGWAASVAWRLLTSPLWLLFQSFPEDDPRCRLVS